MKKEIDLQRFIDAHRRDYGTALREIQNGRKVSHWMWYIFPQVEGLGKSYASRYYAIRDLEEAKAFLQDLYLGKNILDISSALMQLQTTSARDVFGRPDDMKLRSSMTLFSLAAGKDSVFSEVLDKFFGGKADARTKRILHLE